MSEVPLYPHQGVRQPRPHSFLSSLLLSSLELRITNVYGLEMRGPAAHFCKVAVIKVKSGLGLVDVGLAWGNQGLSQSFSNLSLKGCGVVVSNINPSTLETRIHH